MIRAILKENNKRILSHHAPPDIPTHVGKALGRSCDFANMVINRSKEGIFATVFARTIEGNSLKQFRLGIRVVDDLQHPKTRLALAITSS